MGRNAPSAIATRAPFVWLAGILTGLIVSGCDTSREDNRQAATDSASRGARKRGPHDACSPVGTPQAMTDFARKLTWSTTGAAGEEADVNDSGGQPGRARIEPLAAANDLKAADFRVGCFIARIIPITKARVSSLNIEQSDTTYIRVQFANFKQDESGEGLLVNKQSALGRPFYARKRDHSDTFARARWKQGSKRSSVGGRLGLPMLLLQGSELQPWGDCGGLCCSTDPGKRRGDTLKDSTSP